MIKMNELIAMAKRRGFFWPAYEMYGGSGGLYDYGPLGVTVKNRIIEDWRKIFVKRDNYMEIETPTLTPQAVLQASGHTKNFVEGDVKTMFEVGSDYYLRPETAQGVFVNFNRLYNINRKKLPFGVAQIGRSYRNEISPRKGLIRMREFTQMELEIFLEDGGAVDDYIHHLNLLTDTFRVGLGIPKDAFRFRRHTTDELAHYARDCWDAEILIDGEWVEVAGVADRGTHDAEAHGIKVNGKYPHVVEASFGLDRIFLATLYHAFETTEDGRKVMRLPERFAPFDYAIFPLSPKNDDQLLRAGLIQFEAKMKGCHTYIDMSGSIGKRYARADEIGVPKCITVEDNCVTVRDRDTKEQKMQPFDDVFI